MAVYNVHERLLPDRAGGLIDDLGRIWPEVWPRMWLDRPLAVGASGGHGPIRYTVESYVPGKWVRFRISAPRGFVGLHEFTSHAAPGGTVLRHTIAMHLRGWARLTWPLAIRWLHDAMIEDILDRAELATTGAVAHPSRWSPYVRLLRSFGGSANRNRSEPGVTARV
jgi:hypothetical protein